MTIGIFYICTGKYSIFWNTFYDSAEKYFLPGTDKLYFVFTDDESIRPASHIHIYKEKPKGFPLDSLLRFDMFLNIKDDTTACDYLFFFNSNMQFVQPVTTEMILPKWSEGNLTAVLHPGYFDSLRTLMLPYEKQHRRSAAYIPYTNGETYHYFMGGVNGGTRKAYYDLIQSCHDSVHQDMDNNIMAIYHDESHLNKYLHNREVRILPPSFGFPEGDTRLPYKPIIVILNKAKHGGKYFDKLPRKDYGRRVFLFLKRIILAAKWKTGL